ncbi:hypothetical protein LSH36_644g01014 [Paralvinella palmiformis]|uniref:Uncharacterized protein n=1 Tax=Paralvinella palmiformis TaxID=53620 RepID=A0AAD9MWU4_9ANNE|nr:hypothetical protein LSH36_644g01014 [Paralvinella palmiformis]
MIERDRSSDYTHLVNEMNGSETQRCPNSDHIYTTLTE